MTQSVIDLFELIEIDEQQCRQSFGRVRNCQQPLDFIAEVDTVGQARQLVETGKMADPGFRDLPFGDVLNQNHGAAAGHWLKSPGERAGRLGICGGDIPRLRILDFRDNHLSAYRRERAGANAGRDDIGRARSAMHEMVGQIHHLLEAMVHDGQMPIGGKHAQPMRHVVQGGVELASQRRLALAPKQRSNENLLQPCRNVLEGEEEQHVQDRHPEVVWVSINRQHHRQRPASQQHLHVKYPRTPVGSTAAGSHIAKRDGYADQMRGGIGAAKNRHDAPQPQRGRVEHRAHLIANFPARGFIRCQF